MGLAMASIYIIMGLSYFMRALIPINNLQKTYLITVLLCAGSYAILPTAVSLGARSIPVLFVSLGGFGLFQSSSYPVLVKLMKKYYTVEEDGRMIGIWSSCGDMGNILGFFVFTVIVYYLHLPWQACLLFASIIASVLGVVIYLLPIENSE